MNTKPLLLFALVPATLLLSLEKGAAGAGLEFVRGDMNLDGQVSLADVMQVFESLAFGAAPIGCLDTADVYDVGQISKGGISEAGFLWSWLFRSGNAPSAPFPNAGPDPTSDNIGCLSSQITPPGPPLAGLKLSWEAPGFVRRGDQDVAIYLRVTAPRAMGSFSIAQKIRKDLFTNVRADFAETSFPKSERKAFETSPLFQAKVVPLPNDPDYDLLLVGALFLKTPANFGLNGVNTFSRISFGLTQGPVTNARLLRLVFNVRFDAPVEKQSVAIASAGTLGLIPGDAGRFHGLRDELTPTDALTVASTIPGEGTSWRPVVWDAGEFLRADANGDHCRDLSDAVSTLGFLFLGQTAPPCPDASDANDDGKLDISDSVFTLAYLFSGGPAPPVPPILDPGSCWFDDSADALGPCEYECDVCPR